MGVMVTGARADISKWLRGQDEDLHSSCSSSRLRFGDCCGVCNCASSASTRCLTVCHLTWGPERPLGRGLPLLVLPLSPCASATT
eukprot:6346796-Amphidinium_carterae.1